MSTNYEIESAALVMTVFRGSTNEEVASAQACTHGGWAIYLGKVTIRSQPVAFVDGDRNEARAYLEKRFPGLREVA